MPRGKRTNKPLEERIAEIDARIEYHKTHIVTWEEKKAKLLASKNKNEYKATLDTLLAKGLTPEEILKKFSEDA